MVRHRPRADRRDRPLVAVAARAGEPLRDPSLHLVARQDVEGGVEVVVPTKRRQLALVPVNRAGRPLPAVEVGSHEFVDLADRHGRTWRPASDRLPSSPRILVGLGLGQPRRRAAAHALRVQPPAPPLVAVALDPRVSRALFGAHRGQRLPKVSPAQASLHENHPIAGHSRQSRTGLLIRWSRVRVPLGVPSSSLGGNETSACSAAADSEPSLGRFGEADGGQSPQRLPKTRAEEVDGPHASLPRHSGQRRGRRRRDGGPRRGGACSSAGWTTSDSAKVTFAGAGGWSLGWQQAIAEQTIDLRELPR